MARNKYDIDEKLESEFNINHLKRLAKYVVPYKKQMFITVIIMFISSFMSMLGPLFLQKVMDEMIPAEDIRGIFLMGILFIGTLFVIAFCMKKKIIIMSKVGQEIIHQIRIDIFEHLQKLPFSYYDDRPHGKILVRVVNYINSLSDLLSNGIINTITDLFSLILIVAFMFALNAKLTIVCLCGLPVLFLVILLIKTKQRVAWRECSNKSSNMNAYIQESIQGIKVTQSFVREDENLNIFRKVSGEYRQKWMKAVKIQFLFSPAVDNIAIWTTAAIYIVGVAMVTDPSSMIEVGVLTAFISYINRFWAPINNIANFYNSILNSMAYLERVFETIDEPLIVEDCEGAVEMPKAEGNVEFKNVTFGYEENNNVLENVSFKVKKGESIALVGPTGAGKTTIVNLISRFYNLNSGEIFIDGNDISKVTLKSLRSQMGIMLQDSFIFSGTIIDNIRYSKLDATDEEVIAAAKAVCAHDFIMNMEKGYYTEVNERGTRLSVGQRQLISFARALLADPKILILDEATSSIDTETEIVLQEGLNKLLEGRTSFIIAHRLSTIKNSDCIMYIGNKGIMERGTHDELMALKGEYYKLYTSQYAFLNQ